MNRFDYWLVALFWDWLADAFEGADYSAFSINLINSLSLWDPDSSASCSQGALARDLLPKSDLFPKSDPYLEIHLLWVSGLWFATWSALNS